MKLKSKSLKGLVFSDVHLGHRKTPTTLIVENILTYMLPDTKASDEYDIVFMTGDLLDRILTAADEDYITFNRFMVTFLTICANRGIIVRFLEGTPSHDYSQQKIVEVMAGLLPVNFKYVDVLAYEYIEELGIDIIYIPDEWRHDNRITQEEVIELMRFHNVDKVDYVLMHGMFDHQIPAHLVSPASIHDADFYNSIVRRNVYCGHVHLHSTRDKIVVPGSFDRLTFGEEGPKGFIRFESTADESINTFMENKGAKLYTYIPITVAGRTLEEIGTLMLDKALEISYDVPAGSAFRFKIDEEIDVSSFIKVIQKNYPGIIWEWRSGTDPNEKQTILPKVTERVSKEDVLNITKDNVVQLVMDNIVTDDNDLKNLTKEILESIAYG